MLPGVALGAIASHHAPHQFTAQSVVQIQQIASEETPRTRRGERANAIDFNRHLRLLSGAEVAKRVIAELDLGWQELHAPRSLLQQARRQAARLLRSPSGRISDVRAYAARLRIEPIEATGPERRVRIAFTTGAPDRAAEIANAHARAYAEAAREQAPLLSGADRRRIELRVAHAAEDVAAARAALDAHRAKHDIASIEMRSSAIITRLSQLDRRHLEALAERERLDVQIELIEADQFNSLPAVTASDLVWHLKESIAQLRAQRARLQAEFRPDADQLTAVENRLRGVRRRLAARIDVIASAIRAEHDAASEAEEGLREQLDEQRARAEALEKAVTGYSRLEHDLVAHQRTFRKLDQERQTLTAGAAGPSFRASIVHTAAAPEAPAHTRPAVLAASLLVGLCGGVLLSLCGDRRKPNFRTLDQAERQLGLAALGALPNFRRGAEGKGGSFPGQDTDEEDDDEERAAIRRQGMEAFREIQKRILASAPSEPPCSLLFAGAAPAAGCTSVALNIAALLSQQNEPVLVIDAHFRSARCHEVLRTGNEIGLADVLCNRVEPFEAIRAISEHLSLLPAGPMPPDPTKLLASTEMAECLIALQKHYAYVIVDGPPVEPASDSLLLSPLFDGVILVADQPTSTRGVIDRATQALRDARAKTLGIVFNRAPFPPPSDDAQA